MFDINNLPSNIKKVWVICDGPFMGQDCTVSQDNKKDWVLKNKVKTVKLLGLGDIKDKINIEVNFISKSAKEKIEKKGGSIKLINKL